MNMDLYQKSKRSIIMVTLATVVIEFFWGQFFQAPSVIRAFFSFFMILSVFLFPYEFIKNNDFDKISNVILRLLLLLGCVAIIRSVLDENPGMYAFGNKWLTLFGNEICALLFIPPLYTYLATVPLCIAFLKKINHVYLFLGSLFILLSRYPLGHILICLPVFFSYVKRDYKILIGVAVLQSLLAAIMEDNPARIYIVFFGFALSAYILVYVIKRKALIKFFCIICIISPIFIFLPMLYKSDLNEPSVFNKLETYVNSNTGNRGYGTDTRTFLYYEMAWDLKKTDTWIWGKGAYAFYYSDLFDDGKIGRFGRQGSEVYLLNFLMHGGIIYAFLYFLLLVYAVYKGLWKSNNRFVQCIAVVITGWYFCGFVGDLIGCRYYHMVFFMLLGCCLSKRFLSMNDEEICSLLDDNVIV